MADVVKQVYTIWYQDLERLFKEHLDVEIDIQDGEYHNNSFTENTASIDPEMWDFELDEPLGKLSQMGIIPEGPYIITIWW